MLAVWPGFIGRYSATCLPDPSNTFSPVIPLLPVSSVPVSLMAVISMRWSLAQIWRPHCTVAVPWEELVPTAGSTIS